MQLHISRHAYLRVGVCLCVCCLCFCGGGIEGGSDWPTYLSGLDIEPEPKAGQVIPLLLVVRNGSGMVPSFLAGKGLRWWLGALGRTTDGRRRTKGGGEMREMEGQGSRGRRDRGGVCQTNCRSCSPKTPWCIGDCQIGEAGEGGAWRRKAEQEKVRGSSRQQQAADGLPG